MTASRPGDLLQWPRIMLEYLRERREKERGVSRDFARLSNCTVDADNGIKAAILSPASMMTFVLDSGSHLSRIEGRISRLPQ
jgi:hypothetical protein